MAYLEFMPGAAAPDDANPPETDNATVVFEADAVEHRCGWTVYVPTIVAVATSLTLRFYFVDDGIGAGTVRFVTEYYSTSETAILASGSTNIDVVVPNVALTVYYVDTDISSWITSDTKIFSMSIKRNSVNVADTFAHGIGFLLGRTLEV